MHEHKLVINPAEAQQVELICRAYLRLPSVSDLRDHLMAIGMKTKLRPKCSGASGGGRVFSRGNLYDLLQNRLYRGEVAHNGQSYPGEHEPISTQQIWDAVQAKLARNRVDRAGSPNTGNRSLLAGLVYGGDGERLTPSLAAILQRVEVNTDKVEIGISLDRLISFLVGEATHQSPTSKEQPMNSIHVLSISASLKRAGQEMRMVVAAKALTDVDQALIRLINQALHFKDQLLQARDEGIAELAEQAGVCGSHYTRVLRLAFLAPDIIATIVQGQQPAA